MRLTKIILLFFSFLFIHSCKNEIEEEKKKVNDSNVKVNKYIISECRNDCLYEPNNLISSSIEGNVVHLQLGLNMNCVWMDGGKVRSVYVGDDTVDIYLVPVSSGALGCECYFYHDIEILNLSKIPNTILINSKNVATNKYHWANEEYMDSILNAHERFRKWFY